MEIRLPRCSAVLVGAWNVAIFAPAWVGNRIFEREELELEVSFGDAVVLKFRDPLVELVVTSSALQFLPRVDSPDAFARLQGLALRVLNTLNETPVRAFGVNFGYDLSPDARAPGVLRSLQRPISAERVKQLRREAVHRSFDLGGLTANVVVAQAAVTTLDVNFHFELQQAAAAAPSRLAAALLEKHPVATLKDLGTQLLWEVVDSKE